MKRALPDGLELDDDVTRVDLVELHRYLSTEAYWALGRSLLKVERLVREASRVVGLYESDHMIGFARGVTDDNSFAYLADVYVLPEFRRRGLGLEIVREMVENGPYERIRWLLHTRDAQGLYEQVGFGPPGDRLMERPGGPLADIGTAAGADLDTLSDLCTPWCLRVVATLRIADHIAAGMVEIDGLAAAARCDADALHNVLGRLVDKGVFEEPEPGRFTMNEAARGLLDPSRRFDLDLEGIGGRFASAWGTLPTYVRTGAPGYHEVFGLPFWEDLAAHPEIGAEFDALMGPAGHGTPDPEFRLTGGWQSVRTVVDVGGGTGAMLAEILRVHPKIHGTLVDLPMTVDRSGEIFQVAGVADRVETVGQSFFDTLPEGADLYLLKKVLNDWPDREATAILSRCAEAARPTGRVVVLGGVVPEDAPKRLAIEMMLVGGRHRTVSELGKLAREAGLKVVAAERQVSGMFVVECRPD
jgi:GNAT superfamily N-acetyltransferase/precorrin-6B methylase 2